MMKALVTGAAGFVGRHITRHLELAGWNVVGTDSVWGTAGAPNFMMRDSLFDLVVHAAAAGPNRKAIDTQLGNFPYNVALDASLINWCIETKQRRLVYLSSSAIYSNSLNTGTFGPQPFTERQGMINSPSDVYGETKRIGEKMALQARDAGVAVHIVRPFSGYGEDQSEDFPFRAFVERAKRREDPFTIWGNADQVRDWIHIDDICRAIIALIELDYQEPVNLCTGVGTSMRQLAQLVVSRSIDKEYDPEFVVDTGAPMGVFHRVGDPALLHSIYVPQITIEEGVRRAFK